MALDPHPDREPGMDARVWTEGSFHGMEFARSSDTYDGETRWFRMGGYDDAGVSWQQLATGFPDAVVVLP